MATAAPYIPTMEQLDAAKSILDDDRFYDDKNDKFTVYFRTQKEADMFMATIQGLSADKLESRTI